MIEQSPQSSSDNTPDKSRNSHNDEIKPQNTRSEQYLSYNEQADSEKKEQPEYAALASGMMPDSSSYLEKQIFSDADSLLPKESNVKENTIEIFAHAKYAYASVVCIFLMYQFAGGALHSALRSIQSASLAAILQGVGQSLFMLIPALIVMRYSPLKIEGLMRFGGTVTPVQWIAGLFGIFGVQAFNAGFLVLQERLMPSFLQPLYQQLQVWSGLVEQAYRDFFAGTTAPEAVRALISGAVVPAFAEEILFRGLFQRSLEQVRSPRHAILATAFIFGVLHFNPLSFVALVLIGAYLGFLAYYTQSLALPIVAHFLNNAIAIVALYAPKQYPETAVETLPLSNGFLLAALGIVILGGAFMTITRYTPQVLPSSKAAISRHE